MVGSTAGVDQSVGLLPNGGEHTGMAVADVQYADAGGEVDIPVPIDVGEAGATSLRGKDRHRRRHATRQVAIPLFLKLPRPWPWPLPHRRYPKGRGEISLQLGGWS